MRVFSSTVRQEHQWSGGSLFSGTFAQLFLLFSLGFGIRLIFVHLAPNNTTDAWSRYHCAVLWLQHPQGLPPATATDAWLPLHFWLLGAVLWVWNSELSARIFTAALGSLTLLFYWSIFARVLDRRIASASAFVLAVFGFHIAFSVTTGSEVPTIFFVAGGIYCWLRFSSHEGWTWAVLAALLFGAASLCRFEAWLCAPVLAFALLDPAETGFVEPVGQKLWKAMGFGVLGSSAALGWMVFSYFKWGDVLELPHRTMWLNLHFHPAELHHSVVFRLFAVPAALLISLSPVVAALAFVGFYAALKEHKGRARAIAVLALTIFVFNYWNSVRYELTQARYTLLYSWLFIPFAFEGVRWLVERVSSMKWRLATAAVLGFFVLWQAGIMLGASFGRPAIADRLAQMSPLLPLHHEMRALTGWISNHRTSGAVVLDDYNWDSPAVARFTHIEGSQTFQLRAEDYADQNALRQELRVFIATNHPDLVIASPYGPIGRMWSVKDQNLLEVDDLGIKLQREWKSEHWRAFAVSYRK